MLTLIAALVIAVSAMNLVRITMYLVGADVHSIRTARGRTGGKHRPENTVYQPAVSLIVPVHNEAAVIDRTLTSLLAVDYPNLQIIVADDGSTDNTLDLIYDFKTHNDPGDRLEVITQDNGGKADCMNNAIRNHATGELVMCLDGDSTLAADAVTRSVAYFADPAVMATASNVNIMKDGTLLGLVQRYEYLISYQMKKAHSVYNIEYIVGGIGSMFRKSALEEVGLYDTNTMTEDIDLTMKLIAKKGNRDHRIAYAFDALTYTEAVPSFGSLVRQRYRWKYGRLQAFFKYRSLFFSMRKKHGFALSWFALPYALFLECLYMLEPVIVTAVLGAAIWFRSPETLLSAVVLISAYVSLTILGTKHLSWREKLVLCLLSPAMYLAFYLLSVVEYAALVKALWNLRKLPTSISEDKVTWTSPERSAA